MYPNENTILQLMQEQQQVKQELDWQIRLDLLSVNIGEEHYNHIKTLAARIIQIEGIVSEWINQINVGELYTEL